ncbi:MAG: Gfo/Idh/MocA family protein [Vulcanimicrobiaceae bacterium]
MPVRPLRCAVIGCGLIGTRRAEQAASNRDTRLVAVADASEEVAREAGTRHGVPHHADWKTIATDPDVDVVVAATPNAFLCEIALAALGAGKHVLVEKPMGRNLVEARLMADAAAASGRLLKVGFNHRYHPAIRRAHELVAGGAIGAPISVRARYGHGGRPGYEREWRGNARLAGGGELTDQGVHVADLLHWFLGLPGEGFAYLQTAVWPIEPLEDGAFALFRFPGGCVASMHTSWTQWKNIFSFEIAGTAGAIAIEGLGGSYGVERLIETERRMEGGAPDYTETRFEEPDRSWELEWNDFVQAIRSGTPYDGTPADGLAAMRMLDALYASAREDRPVTI